MYLPHWKIKQELQGNMKFGEAYGKNKLWTFYQDYMNQDGVLGKYDLISQDRFNRLLNKWSEENWLEKRGKNREIRFYHVPPGNEWKSKMGRIADWVVSRKKCLFFTGK